MAVSENWTIIDDNDKVIGPKNYDELSKDDRWRITSVFITNSSGEVLLSRRHPNKRHMPNVWGPAAAGSVEFHETYEQNAYKELEEEIGISGITLKYHGNFVIDFASNDNRAVGIFSGVFNGDIETLQLEENEVSEVRWISIDALLKELDEHEDTFVPGMEHVMEAVSQPTHKQVEFVQIVNEKNELLCYKNRRGTSDTDAFRISAVMIEDGQGNTLTQKRSLSKNTGSGKWENAAGGCVNSSETPEQNAYKELFEEIGVDNVDLEHIAITTVKTRRGDRHCYWYKGVINKDDWPVDRFVLEEGSVDAVTWANKEELFNDRDTHPETYMPSSVYWRELFS